MNLQVGDIVEVIKSYDYFEQGWVGRQLTVTEVVTTPNYYHFVEWREAYYGPAIRTIPRIVIPAVIEDHCWCPEQLKKINPPDWKVETERKEEIQV